MTDRFRPPNPSTPRKMPNDKALWGSYCRWSHTQHATKRRRGRARCRVNAISPGPAANTHRGVTAKRPRSVKTSASATTSGLPTCRPGPPWQRGWPIRTRVKSVHALDTTDGAYSGLNARGRAHVGLLTGHQKRHSRAATQLPLPNERGLAQNMKAEVTVEPRGRPRPELNSTAGGFPHMYRNGGWKTGHSTDLHGFV